MKTIIIVIAILVVGFIGFKVFNSQQSVPSPTPSQTAEKITPQKEGFIVKGTSGKDILLDRMWDRGCIPGSNGVDWTDDKRTLTGLELVTTMIDYQNGSKTPDCKNGRVGSSVMTNKLTSDNIMVPITWVNTEGKPAAAPTGLEGVSKANGATALVTAAKVVPETKERADQLNKAKFCGFTDWKGGVAKDVVECFTGGFNPLKGTIVVDDRTMPWKVYDSVGETFDSNGYQTNMANYLPHQGPF